MNTMKSQGSLIIETTGFIQLVIAATMSGWKLGLDNGECVIYIKENGRFTLSRTEPMAVVDWESDREINTYRELISWVQNHNHTN